MFPCSTFKFSNTATLDSFCSICKSITRPFSLSIVMSNVSLCRSIQVFQKMKGTSSELWKEGFLSSSASIFLSKALGKTHETNSTLVTLFKFFRKLEAALSFDVPSLKYSCVPWGKFRWYYLWNCNVRQTILFLQNVSCRCLLRTLFSSSGSACRESASDKLGLLPWRNWNM